jgi:cellulose synthase operon protein YhjQ
MLADTTAQGLLPFYFGAKELHPGVVRTFAPPNGRTDAPVYMVSYGLDAPGSNTESHRKMADELLANSRHANRMLIDLGQSFTWIVEKLAASKPMVLVPLAADMNSIISLQAVEKVFSAMRDAEGEPLRPVYLLNQFDASLPLHLDVREVLRQQLGDRLLPVAIRRAAGVSEALAEGMTIVDYDPDSSAAQDFLGLANWIRAVSAPATAGFRNLRWSER